jgi:gliding motility-associated lipoprotein GldH
MKATLNILVFGALLAIISACGEKPFFEKYYSFEGNEWNQRVKPSFVLEVKDISEPYNFVLTLRTTTSYKYNNLWIYLNTKTPDGKTAREPFQVYITNPDGTWIGKKTGTIVENELIFKKRKLPMKGKYVFTLEQGITESKIDEVLDIGLRMETDK